MKLKYLVGALGLIASAASHATILTPSNATGSELVLVVWEQAAPDHAPDQSFTLDLGVTLGQFVANNSTSATLASLGSSDSIWTNFLASSDTTDAGALQWAVLGGTSKNPISVLGTVQNGQESTVTQGPYATNSNLISANTQVAVFIGNVNGTGTHLTQTNGESVNAVGSGAYFMDYQLNNLNNKAWANSNPIGATAEVTEAIRTNPVLAETVQPGLMTFANNGGTYVLSYNVAAVPEASGIAMTFAGLIGIGFVGLRRRSGRND